MYRVGEEYEVCGGGDMMSDGRVDGSWHVPKYLMDMKVTRNFIVMAFLCGIVFAACEKNMSLGCQVLPYS